MVKIDTLSWADKILNNLLGFEDEKTREFLEDGEGNACLLLIEDNGKQISRGFKIVDRRIVKWKMPKSNYRTIIKMDIDSFIDFYEILSDKKLTDMEMKIELSRLMRDNSRVRIEGAHWMFDQAGFVKGFVRLRHVL